MKKLVIKLKIPQGAQLLNCPSCKRSFKNAKALGGHKRVHIREARQNQNQNQSNQLQIANLETSRVVQDTNFSCPVCHQGFASARSVRAHMRKHPDRNWRGINPPIPNSEPYLALQEPNQQLMALEGPHENQVDHPPLMALQDGPHPADENQVNHQPLMALQDGPHQGEEDEHVGPGLLMFPSGWSTTGRRGRPGKAPMNDNPLIATAAGKPEKLLIGGGSSLENIKNPESKSSSIKGKEPMFVYKVSKAVKGQNNNNNKLYSCTVCGKSFGSYRALGGHKSHHRVKKIIKSSGQESAVIASGAIVPYIEQETGKQSKGLGFDLNELPPEWED